MHRAHTADTGPAHIFIHNGSPQALVGCYENRTASFSPMHRAHTADTGRATIFIHNGAPQAPVGCHGGVGSMRSTQSTAGLPLRLPASQGEDVFPVSVFLLIQVKRRAGAVCRAGRERFARPISANVVRPRASKWRIRRGVIPPRLMSRGSGPDRSAPTAGKERPLFGPNAFRAYFFTDGRQPFVPAASRTPACFEPILRFPFFEAERPFVGAHRRAAIQRC